MAIIKTGLQYHNHSSYQRDKMTGHSLDWKNQPMVFKDYPGITPVSLPSDFSLPEKKLSSVLKEREIKDTEKGMDVNNLSLILRLSYSLTAKTRHSGGDFYFRNVASAGALYPTEIYVATNSVNGLDDGLYHFAIHRHCFYPIRSRDLSRYIVRGTQAPEGRIPALTFFLTAIFFRSAWKYRDRSYRYHLLDTGHLVENLALALKALDLPSKLSFDFDDGMVNHLLGVDATKEVSLAVAHVPDGDFVSDEKVEKINELPERMQQASRVAGNEIDYPAIGEVHRAGTSNISEARPETEMLCELGVAPDAWTKNIFPSDWPEVKNYSEALYNRRSRRNFIKGPIPEDCFMALLDSLCITDSGQSTAETGYYRSVCTGFLAGNAQDMAPGFYLLDTSGGSTGLITPGFFMEQMAHICLDQAWLANAAVHFLFIANLNVLDNTWGTRGYRHSMMAAGRMGERLYLAATAMDLGCCGIGAFYDGEAAGLLGLNKQSRLLYLVAVGPIKAGK